MLALTLLAELAAQHASKVPFYILGGGFALFAFALSAVGITRHQTFPPSAAAGRALLAVAVLLAAGAMFTAAYTA